MTVVKVHSDTIGTRNRCQFGTVPYYIYILWPPLYDDVAKVQIEPLVPGIAMSMAPTGRGEHELHLQMAAGTRQKRPIPLVSILLLLLINIQWHCISATEAEKLPSTKNSLQLRGGESGAGMSAQISDLSGGFYLPLSCVSISLHYVAFVILTLKIYVN